MKKLIILCLLITPLLYGCSGLQFEYNQDLTLRALEKDHPLGDIDKRQFLLTEKQFNEIVQYGVKIGEDEKLIEYYSMTRSREYGVLGDGFLIKGEGEYGSFELICHVLDNRVYQMHIFKTPVDQTGKPVIHMGFVKQFLGKDYTYSFELVKDIDDLLSTPVKIRPIKNAPITSEKIAEEVRKWLVITKVAKL